MTSPVVLPAIHVAKLFRILGEEQETEKSLHLEKLPVKWFVVSTSVLMRTLCSGWITVQPMARSLCGLWSARSMKWPPPLGLDHSPAHALSVRTVVRAKHEMAPSARAGSQSSPCALCADCGPREAQRETLPSL